MILGRIKLIEQIFLQRNIYFKIFQLNCSDMNMHKTQSSLRIIKWITWST